MATNHPNPWRAAINPSSRIVSSARRTVTRLTANSVDNSDSLGSTDPADAARTRSPQLVGDLLIPDLPHARLPASICLPQMSRRAV